MPHWTPYELTGLLVDGRPYPLLRITGGGAWRLDISGRYAHLIGQQVRVKGTRSGFDMLDVDQIMLT